MWSIVDIETIFTKTELLFSCFPDCDERYTVHENIKLVSSRRSGSGISYVQQYILSPRENHSFKLKYMSQYFKRRDRL